MASESNQHSTRFWTDDGFEVVLSDDYDALVEQLEALEHLRDLCLQYMNAKEGEEDERCDAIFDYVASGLASYPAKRPSE